MSTSNVGTVYNAQPIHPLSEEFRSTNEITLLSPAGKRLLWSLDAPFPDAISVMRDEFSPDSLEPYFSNGNWHPVSQEPISEPKISSITVGVSQLDDWEDAWEEYHEEHGDPGDGQEGRWYGELEDYDYDPNDSDRGPRLLGCCGEPRPRNRNLRIEVRPASGSSFVTIHDYVSTLHPWLMGMKEDIRRSTDVWDGKLTEMVVNCNGLNALHVDEKSDWIRRAVIASNIYNNPLNHPDAHLLGPTMPVSEHLGEQPPSLP